MMRNAGKTPAFRCFCVLRPDALVGWCGGALAAVRLSSHLSENGLEPDELIV